MTQKLTELEQRAIQNEIDRQNAERETDAMARKERTAYLSIEEERALRERFSTDAIFRQSLIDVQLEKDKAAEAFLKKYGIGNGGRHSNHSSQR